MSQWDFEESQHAAYKLNVLWAKWGRCGMLGFRRAGVTCNLCYPISCPGLSEPRDLTHPVTWWDVTGLGQGSLTRHRGSWQSLSLLLLLVWVVLSLCRRCWFLRPGGHQSDQPPGCETLEEQMQMAELEEQNWSPSGPLGGSRPVLPK